MNREKANYFINIGMGIAFLLVFCTGVIKFPGLLGFLGISRIAIPLGTLSKIHDWTGIALGAFVFLHIVLHFRWIICMTKTIFGKKQK